MDFWVYAANPDGTLINKPSDKTYKEGETLDFTVHYPVAVTVNTDGGTPSIPITIGSKVVDAEYSSGSGTNDLIFSYTVKNGDLDLDGIDVGTSILKNGGTIRDALGNDAVETINGIGDTSGILIFGIVTYNVSIDTIIGGSITASQTTAIEGDIINLTIKPDSGKRLKEGTLKYNDGISDYNITGSSFTMPAASVTITAEFEDVLYTVTFDKNNGYTEASPVTMKVLAGSSIGTLPIPPARSRYNFNGWNTAPDGTGTVFTAATTVNSDLTVYAQWTYVPSGGGGSSSSTPSTNTSTGIVIVNGEEHAAGTESMTNENGNTVVTVEINKKVIKDKIDEAGNNGSEEADNLMQIQVTNTEAKVVRVGLDGDFVKKLYENSFAFSVKIDNVEYIMPAEVFNIEKVAADLNVPEEKPKDIKVELRITKLDEKVVERYRNIAIANGTELIFPPVKFEVVAKVLRSHGTTEEMEISGFRNYMDRVMEIPENVEPMKVKAGIVFNENGTYNYVPIEVYQKDGKWYARLSPLTNSEYYAIRNMITEKFLDKHWVKDAISNLSWLFHILRPLILANK